MKSVSRTPFQFQGVNSRATAGDVFAPNASGKRLPVLVLCHGFKGFKDWGFFPVLAEHFAHSGMLVYTFNFSHNGCDIDGYEERDLDAFRSNCLAFEEQDLRIVLDRLRNGELPHAEQADTSAIHLLGHSRGGSAVIRAGDTPGVASLVLLASIAQPPAVSADDEAKWRSEGSGWTENWRTKMRLPLGMALLEELLHDRLLLRDRIKRLTIPICIIHGDADASVPLSAAHELKSWAPHAELHVLPGGGHTFGIVHPYAGESPDFSHVLAIVSDFLPG